MLKTVFTVLLSSKEALLVIKCRGLGCCGDSRTLSEWVYHCPPEPAMVDDSQTLGGAHQDHCCLFLLGGLLQTIIYHLVESAVVFPVLVECMELGSCLPGSKRGHGKGIRPLVFKKTFQVPLAQLVGTFQEFVFQLFLLALCVRLPKIQLQIADFRFATCIASGQQREEGRRTNQTPS